MFDVKPVDPSGSVDVSRITSISPQVNLKKAIPPARVVSTEKKNVTPITSTPTKREVGKDEVLRDLESTLNAPHDHRAILTSVGAQVTDSSRITRPRYRPILPPKQSIAEEHHAKIVSELQRPLRTAPMAPLPDVPVTLVASERPSRNSDVEQWMTSRPKPQVVNLSRSGQKTGRRKLLASLMLIPLAYAGHYAMGLKDRVINEGTQAVQNLEEAKDDLSNLDFLSASENFLSAYESFSQAGSQLNFVGASLGSLLSSLPGGEQLKSAQNLVEIGKLVADTGKSMSDAMAIIARTGSILNPQGNSTILAAQIIEPLNAALSISDTNLKKARVLLADIDPALIPEDKRDTFLEFKEKFPQLQELVSQGSQFADFLETMVGVQGTKRYLVLFQNSTEMRPTGGFPGSYAVITFERGKLKDYKVDDIYNIDGQIKELIIPPKQLQHITPTWAMRDANWFIDFPTSAKKVMSFYKKESGLAVDGVITISPDVFTRILEVIGSIEMPAYKLTITAENFLATVQKEVEYDRRNDAQPKQILVDMAPIVLERLHSADHEKWLEVFNALVQGMERKDVLMYFRDVKLQNFAVEKGFAGEVKQTDSDYLMVTATNVKGSKTDAVTDTVLKVGTTISNGEIKHKLTIGRTHNGGTSPYGFYNKQNPAFMRVLVPRGSKLTSINGQSITAYAPIVQYDDHFVQDSDLVQFERTFTIGNQPGVWTYEEAGKTGFAFWMVVNPGATRIVELEYTVPSSVVESDYTFYMQKQPGLKVRSFHFEVEEPTGVSITSSKPNLNHIGDVYTYSGKLETDVPITLELQ